MKPKEELTPDEAAYLMLYGDVEYHSDEIPAQRYISRRYEMGETWYGFGATPLDAAIESQNQFNSYRKKISDEEDGQ